MLDSLPIYGFWNCNGQTKRLVSLEDVIELIGPAAKDNGCARAAISSEAAPRGISSKVDENR